jgi:6-phosphogluconolactonase
MRTRFTWIVAILTLVTIGLLTACSTKYSSSSNGLVVVPTLGAAVMETFSLDLSNGHVAQINNVNGPPTNGVPTVVILDPAGAFAYLLVSQNPAVPGSATGVQAFQVGSDGKLASGTTTTLNSTSPSVNAPCVTPSGTISVSTQVSATPVVPGALAIDSAGKYLFVADVATSGQTLPYLCNAAMVTSTVPVPGSVSVFTVSSGSLTEVTGSPFTLPGESGGSTPSASALAVTPTVYPQLYSPCSATAAPTTENLYVTDSVNNVVLNYSVLSTGGLMPVPTATTPGASTGTLPSGVAIDPCNRFAYVANGISNSVSAYTICSIANLNSQPPCPSPPDFSLHEITGSPYPSGDAPGPMAVNPYGGFLYVVDTGSNQISGYEISASKGTLTSFGGAPVVTGSGPNSIAIRNDDTWLFVANLNAGTVSQYAITPSDGLLAPQSAITTLNQPTGVAVK